MNEGDIAPSLLFEPLSIIFLFPFFVKLFMGLKTQVKKKKRRLLILYFQAKVQINIHGLYDSKSMMNF